MDSTKPQKDEPTLEEWMAKIREKKLKPVVTNEHKAKDTLPSRTDRPTGPHDANDIVKLRQGLRSVSTPKWPGANDVKAKINTTAIPQRAQLRSVSDRPLLDTRRSNISGTSDDSATKDTPKSSTDTETKDELTKSAERIQIQDSTLKDSQDGDDDFPLDKESKATAAVTEKSEDEINEPSASSGVVDPDKAVELKLPAKEDDTFPLDVVSTDAHNLEAEETQETPATPVTLSSGVFDTSADHVDLKLPKAENDDFPLDLEPKETAVKETEATETSDLDLGLSTGVVDPDVSTADLVLPSKEDLDAIKSGEEQTDSKKVSHDTPAESFTPGIDDPSQGHKTHTELESVPEPSAPPINDSRSATSPEKSPMEQHESTLVDKKEEKGSEENIPGATIKCSQCAVEIDIDALDRHKCAQAEINQDF